MEGPRNIAAGAIGSRIAGRLTADLILRSPQYMSCVGEYQIDLRANKVAAIENLGATQNQFDSIDLSDNAIMILEGFPQLPRLKTLYLNNNRILRIGRNLEESIPGLTFLVLTNNRLKNLQDVNFLATLPNLVFLSLLGNEIAMKPKYRLYVIHRLKHLKFLDFQRVKPKEREEAEKTFGSGQAEALLAEEASISKTFEPGEGIAAAEAASEQEDTVMEEAGSKAPTAQQITAIKAAIQNAQTLKEVEELEKALVTGHVPSEFKDVNGSADAAPASMDES